MNYAERKKLAFLNHLVVEQGKEASPEEVRWLLDRLRATLSRPDEFDFPEYAALINPAKKEAFALRRLLIPNWTWRFDLPKNALTSRARLVSFSTQCDVHAAYLVIRPWIRVHADTKDSVFEQLRTCSVKLTFDGVEVLVEAPIDKFLLAKDGGGLSWLSGLYVTRDMLVFPAVELDPKSLEALPERPLGVFAPNNTRIELEIKGPSGHENDPMQIIAGLTAMEYTTKADGGGVELSMPREILRRDA